MIIYSNKHKLPTDNNILLMDIIICIIPNGNIYKIE